MAMRRAAAHRGTRPHGKNGRFNRAVV